MIQYVYKNKLFSDLREVVHNNNLMLDWSYILNEFVPFQMFVSGKTFFKGVTIRWRRPYIKSYQQPFDMEKFKAAFSKYGNDFHKILHDEIDLHSIIGEGKKPSNVIEEKMFVENLDDYIDCCCSPVGGVEPFLDFVFVKNEISGYKPKVVFDNGCSALFCNYEYNEMIKEYLPITNSQFSYFFKYMLNFITIASLAKCPLNHALSNSFVLNSIIPTLNQFEDILDRILFININWMLPTEIHIVQQMCNALEIDGHTPFSEPDIILMSYSINASDDILSEIKKNKTKSKWLFPSSVENIKEYFKSIYDSFKSRKLPFTVSDYGGFNNNVWSIICIEKVLSHFKNVHIGEI